MWSKVSSESLLFKEWDDDSSCVVFDPGCGDTHLLEPLASEILRLIDRAPCSSELLAEHLGPLLEDVEPANVIDLIDSCMATLEGAGLVVHRST